MKKFLIILIILSSVVAGIIGYWYYQQNSYSKDILKLEILGPTEVDLAQEIEYIVRFKNNGNIRLEEPILVFEYPDNSIVDEGISLRETMESADLGGSIYPGQEKTFTFKGRLLGKQGEYKVAKVLLSYRPKNLKARYESNTTLTTVIKKVNLSFGFDLPSKIESSKETQFKLNYFSNVEFPLSDLRIIVSYPKDFEFKSSSPKGIDETEWEIGLLNRAEGGRIEISGKLFGEVGEEKLFKAQLGTWQGDSFVLLKEAFKGVEIVKPSLYINQQINGNPEYIASPGDTLHYEILFKNIGDQALADLFLVARLEGELFDFNSIKAPSGEFNQGDDSIVFDWRENSQLHFLDTQKEGKIEFWIDLKDNWNPRSKEDKNLLLRNKIYLSQVRQEFTTKVNSKLEVSQKGYFQDEVFGNSGPIPPISGKETTYTLMWQVENYYNDVENVKVKASLARNVRPSGKIFPESEQESFVFDSESGEIIWEVGNLESGKGIFNSKPNISFQVIFTPDNSQRGSVAEIIGEVEISGQDQFTEIITKGTSPKVFTNLPDDETITEQMGIVK